MRIVPWLGRFLAPTTETSETGTLIAKATPRSLSPVFESRGGWMPVIREANTGDWQRNTLLSVTNVLTFASLYACVTLIAKDIGKLRPKLIQNIGNDVWVEVENPAYSPVLRKPNRFQTRIKFFEQWLISKLITGNTYVLKQRNLANKVEAMFILDPARVRPLVATDGSVYYALSTDMLSGLTQDVTVPQSEIIHDVCVPLYHPLVGVSPIMACGLSATQAINIQENASQFFANGAMPGGVLTAPGFISDETAGRIKEFWDANYTGQNAGKVAVLGDGLKYEAMMMKYQEAQVIEQLKWAGEDVCRAFHVPPYKIGIGAMPSYSNVEALNLEYHSQALQNPIESIELLLDEGLALPSDIGIELDLDQLMRMDTPTRVAAAGNAIGGSIMSVNEARKRFFSLGAVKGGDSVLSQQQNFSLEAIAARDEQLQQQALAPPGQVPTGAQAPRLPAASTPPEADTADDGEDVSAELTALVMKQMLEFADACR